jgi:segregation and condensation protein A
MAAGAGGPPQASYVASLLGAALELVRDGRLEMRQDDAFAPLFLKARAHE